MSDKRIALVTGGNKGIGFEIARQLGRQGMKVFLGARDPERGERAAEDLRGEGLDVTAVQLDVSVYQSDSTGSVVHAVAEVGRQVDHLDVLVNNAGVFMDVDKKPSEVGMEVVEETYAINVFGAIATTQAFLPLLKKGAHQRIVNVSSTLGSLGSHSNPKHHNYGYVPLAYCTSKTALNGVTVMFARELEPLGIKVNCVCPGYTATDMTQWKGTKPAAQGAAVAVRLALIGEDGPTGRYFDEDGELPW